MWRKFSLAIVLMMTIPLAQGQQADTSAAAEPSASQPTVAEAAATPEAVTAPEATQANSSQSDSPNPAAAQAETYRLRPEMSREGATDMGAASLQMTLGLFVVLAVILGLSWLARRFNLAGVGGVAGLKVSAALNVGQKEKILVLDVEGRRLLVGVTAHQITVLQALGDAPEDATGSDFAHRMQTLLKAGSLNDK